MWTMQLALTSTHAHALQHLQKVCAWDAFHNITSKHRPKIKFDKTQREYYDSLSEEQDAGPESVTMSGLSHSLLQTHSLPRSKGFVVECHVEDGNQN